MVAVAVVGIMQHMLPKASSGPSAPCSSAPHSLQGADGPEEALWNLIPVHNIGIMDSWYAEQEQEGKGGVRREV